MQIDRHVDGRLQSEQDRQPGGGKTDERVAVAHRLDERTDHDEGEQSHETEAEHHAEFLRGHGEHEIGMAFGEDALDGALAGAAAEPAAADERFGGDVDVEGIAGGGIEEAVEATAHVAEREVGADDRDDQDPDQDQRPRADEVTDHADDESEAQGEHGGVRV